MKTIVHRLVMAALLAAGLAAGAFLAPSPEARAQSACHPAYVPTETFCVPWTDYDLNCVDIGWAQVYLYDGANDPYGLDSVNYVDNWVTCDKPWEGDYGWGGSGGSAAGVAAAPAPVPATGECDPAYINYCIPPTWVVGDLDCTDMYAQGISWIQLAQIGWDPHNFDSGGDGWGCEG